MYLTIDIGNTRTKAAVFDREGALIQIQIPEGDELKPLHEIISSHAVQHVLVAATGKRGWTTDALRVPGKKMDLSYTLPLPVKLIYTTPHTLGHDRIAGACGAHALFPDQTCLVVDVGTCMTFNVVTGEGLYLGGNIAPGLHMRLRAMHEQTANLPLVPAAWPPLAIGDSTTHALQNGAALGMVMEIEGMIKRVKNAFGTVSVVITGGDASFLAEKLESEIFAEPELVVKGLFKILTFNVQ